MDLKIVKHSIDLMINAAMRINSFNIDNVHNLTVYDVDILRELVDDLKKNISDLKLDDIVLNSNSVDESRFLLSKVLFIIEPYYSDPSHKDLIHIGYSFYLTYIIHSGFISGYQNRYGDNLKPPTNVYHRMTA